jgi:threonine dehydratase
LIIEPSSAVPLAVLLKNRNRFHGQRIGVIITGGNVDLHSCPGCPRVTEEK